MGLFASTSLSEENIDFVIRHLELRVTPAMSESLDQPFTAIEVRNTLFQTYPNKSMIPNGFLPHFFLVIVGSSRGDSVEVMLEYLE